MCRYCENEDAIMKVEEISTCSWGWGGDVKIKQSEAVEKEMAIFLDTRDIGTYLRYADTDDCNCLESGEKVLIEFCPFCGKAFDS